MEEEYTTKSSVKKKNLFLNDFIFLAYAVLIAAIGIFNPTPEYYGGFALFIFGIMLGMFVPVLGIMFMAFFSMGGITIIESELIGKVIRSLAKIDNPIGIYMYLGCNLLLFIFATFFVVLYNIGPIYKSKKYSLFMPLTIYLAAFFMSAILPSIVNYMY